MLAVSASEATEVEIGRIEISFRDGIRWGTKEAGLDGATLTFADHTPGTVEDDAEPDDTPPSDPSRPTRQVGDKDKKGDKKNDKKGDDA